MAVERTLSIIKPDAVAKNVIGKIYSRFESNGLSIAAARAWPNFRVLTRRGFMLSIKNAHFSRISLIS